MSGTSSRFNHQVKKSRIRPLSSLTGKKRKLVAITVIPFFPTVAQQSSYYDNKYEGLKVSSREDLSVIGDLIRSEESASSFFKLVDRDGDGTLRAPEVAEFLRESIGGSSFDEKSEVDTEVLNIMNRLDRNQDEALDQDDMFSHWKQLERLLTAEEVADWVQYAVQLPHEIARIFRDNVVTGYDFPELVENGGKKLETELGITKSSFRRKIVRLVQARMLGIGSIPTHPSDAQKKCPSTTIHLTWKKSTSDGFPVHGYQLQKRQYYTRAFPVDENENTIMYSKNNVRNDLCTQQYQHNFAAAEFCRLQPNQQNNNHPNMEIHPNNNSMKPSSSSSSSQWETIYVGSETELVHHIDENDEHNTDYRVQAWNAVGGSGWVKFESNDVKCQQKPNYFLKSLPSTEEQQPQNTSANSQEKRSSTSFIKQTWFLANVIVNITRFIMTLSVLAVTLFKFKRASVKSTYMTIMDDPPYLLIVMNHFTKRFLGIELIPNREEEDIHDETIKAKGLNGYDSASKRFKRRDFGSSYVSLSDTFKPSSERPKLSRMKTTGTLCSEHSSDSLNINTSSSDLLCMVGNDMKYCSVCRKKYKFPKRFRHHCSRCTATFCHKHGKTTHSNLVACGVPGSCLCQPCLDYLKYGQ